MSYFDRQPFLGQLSESGKHFPDPNDVLPFIDCRPGSRHSVDRAIDSALRSVPLPEGLMTRLGKLVPALCDDTAGRVDYLGC
jgi:hypothetical protein